MRFPGLKLFYASLIIMPLAFCAKESHSSVANAGTDTASTIQVSDTPLAKMDPGVTVTLTDVAYGANAKEKMDIGLVAGRNTSTPFVILLHGGSWSEGDKKDLQSQMNFFMKQGINVANVNYRLTNTSPSSVRWNGILADVAGAIFFVKQHADSLQIRSDHFVSFGFSAGAQLALLHSYSYDSDNLVSAVIGFGTPTKFNDAGWRVNPFLTIARQALPPLTGKSFSADTSSSILMTLSPYFSQQFKPTLLIHGSKDNVVPYSQSVLMDARLNSAGVEDLFITLANAGHSGEGASSQDLNNALYASAVWIKKYSH